MSESVIGDQVWAEMAEAQKIDAVVRGQATLKQMSEGLLDGSEELRRVCRDALAHTDLSSELSRGNAGARDSSHRTGKAARRTKPAQEETTRA